MDTIRFAPSLFTVAMNLNLSSALPDLASDLSIVGPGADKLTIRRNTGGNYAILSITNGSNIILDGLTIANGTGINGGGIFNNGNLTLRGFMVVSNTATHGGGIHNNVTGTLVIENSTIAANSTQNGNGGGLNNNQGSVAVTNSTISGNSTTSSGGGIYNNGTLTLARVTLFTNSSSGITGGGLYTQSGQASLINSILAGSRASFTQADVAKSGSATVVSLGHNLIGIGDGSGITTTTGDQIGTAASPSNSRLGPLQNNGGPTWTCVPASNSPAIDAGISNGLANDQRGRSRTFDYATISNAPGNDGTDMGAVEIAPEISVLGQPYPIGNLRQVEFLGYISPANAWLEDIRGVAVSGDGRHVYIAAFAPESVFVFSRNLTTGHLTFVQRLSAAQVGGLQRVSGLALSPDGRQAYTVSSSGFIVAFSRDPSTGSLTFVEQLNEGQRHGSTEIDGLDSATFMHVAPDGNHVYTASRSENGIAVFRRNTSSGQLTFVEVLKEGQVDSYGNMIDGLQTANFLDFDSGGVHVYVTADGDNSVSLFVRDLATGRLRFVEALKNGQADGAGNIVLGTVNAFSTTVSPDGGHAYVGGNGIGGEAGLAVFSRDSVSGRLSLVESLFNGQNDSTGKLIDGLNAVNSLMLDPDGGFLLAGCEGALVVFRRNHATGWLEFVEALKDNQTDSYGNPLNSFEIPHAMTFSPDGDHVYLASSYNALAIMSRQRAQRLIVSGAQVASLENQTDFGQAISGQPGPTRTFTVRNSGESTLTRLGGFEGGGNCKPLQAKPRISKVCTTRAQRVGMAAGLILGGGCGGNSNFNLRNSRSSSASG